MIRLSTVTIFFIFLSSQFILPYRVSGQDSKENNGSGYGDVLVISLVATPDNSFPEVGTLSPDKNQLEIFGKKTTAWIKTHEYNFTRIVTSCETCRRISTADATQFGEAAIIRLKELINTIGPALALQMKDHESLYPVRQPDSSIRGKITFVVSQADFDKILAQIKLQE